MRLVTPKLNVEVKYKKVSVAQLVPRPEIRMRAKGKLVEEKRVVADKTFLWNGKRLASQIKLIDPETEKPVPSHEALEILEHYNKKYVDEEGREVSKKDIQYFEVKEDGSEVEVRPFDRTSEIRIVKEVPATSMNGMLVESTYELFHTEESIVSALYEEAERYLKEDLVGIALFSWGRGFKQFYAVVYPILKDGKFVWVLKLTQTQVIFSHLMEPPAKIKEPTIQPPTLQTLPPIEALVGTKKKKK